MRLFSTRTSAAGLSVASNVLLITLKIVVGVMTGSVSIISEAIHSALDLAAALIAFFSIRMASQPPDTEHPFGHGKIENVSGTVEAVLILVAAALIIIEAVQRIFHGVLIESIDLGLGVMAISALVNTFVSRHLFRVARGTDSIALEADAQHLSTDVYTSLGVLVGLFAVRITNLYILDPIIALGVALMIIRAGHRVMIKSFLDLIDVRLPESEEAIIRRSIEEHAGGEVIGFHNLRSRKSGRERQIDLHLVMARDASVEEAHRMCDHLEQDIQQKLPHSDITIHIEPCEKQYEECTASCPLNGKAPCYPNGERHPKS